MTDAPSRRRPRTCRARASRSARCASLAESKGDDGAELAAEIDAEFSSLEEALAAHGSLDAGFVDYATLTDADKKALSDEVNALAEPLSQLTATVLGL